MNCPKPHSAFDWDWSDLRLDDSARARAVLARPKETKLLVRVSEANSLIHFALWSQLPTGHPVGELWSETQTDLHASVYLAYGGYYRQALAVLRSWLEIAVHGVFFSAHYGQPSGRYEQWRAGDRNAPVNMRVLAEALANRSGKLLTADVPTILRRLEPLYSTLCHQTHGRGLELYNLQDGRDNVPRFLDRGYDFWWQKTNAVFGCICFLYRLFFTKELSAYFHASSAEMDRAVRAASALAQVIPDLHLLISEAKTSTVSTA